MQSHHIMAIVEYDGTQYFGFQIQGAGKRPPPSGTMARSGADPSRREAGPTREGAASAASCRARTIQGELEVALAQVTQHATRVVGAGRTDAGVHASGQVIHCDALWAHPLPQLKRALNAVLPPDIAIVELREAAPDFHARYSARSREYVYTILNRPVRSPLATRYVYHCAKPLDAEAMDSACACLVGTHDFLPFGWPPRGENTVRTVQRAACRRTGDLVRVDIEADAFLRAMVRRIVGNLVLVGLGELSGDGFAGLLSLRHRRTPAVAAPAHGLCLVKVNY